MKNEKTFTVSRDAMFASTLNHLSGCTHGNDEEKKMFQNAVIEPLSIIIKEDLRSEKGKSANIYALKIAELMGIEQIETEVLQKLRFVSTDEEYKLILKGSYSRLLLDESTLKAVSPCLISLMSLAGVTNLKAAFAELDALTFEATGVPSFF